jgi:hypothetical protein
MHALACAFVSISKEVPGFSPSLIVDTSFFCFSASLSLPLLSFINYNYWSYVPF